MKLPVIDRSGKEVGTIVAADKIFAVPINVSLLAQAVHVYRARSRQVPAKILTRGDVYGSRKKLWRQKGTGRARHGDRFAPQFVGGGVAHGPTGRENYKRKMNEKMRRGALFCGLSAKQREGNLTILDAFGDCRKTNDVALTLKALMRHSSLLVVVRQLSDSMRRAVRNLADVRFVQPEALNAFMVLAARRVIFEKDVIPQLEQIFLGKEKQTR